MLGTHKNAISNTITTVLLLFSVAFDEHNQMCCGPQRIILERRSERHKCCGHEQYDAGTHCCCSNNDALKIHPVASICCSTHSGVHPKNKKQIVTHQEIIDAYTVYTQQWFSAQFFHNGAYIYLFIYLSKQKNIVVLDTEPWEQGRAEATTMSGDSESFGSELHACLSGQHSASPLAIVFEAVQHIVQCVWAVWG